MAEVDKMVSQREVEGGWQARNRVEDEEGNVNVDGLLACQEVGIDARL